jgi:aminomuconate-semialdehyde/2-hydroxymuconate-6-semialdehyde dehydrogenase
MPLITLKNYIGGEFYPAQSNLFINNFDPSNGRVYSTLPQSTAADINAAVLAAEKAFPSWSRTTMEERAHILNKIADGIEARLPLLAAAESKDQGKPVWLAESVDIPRAAHNFRFFAGQILYQQSEAYDHSGQAFNFSIRKPVGVAGLISPWNLPLYLLTWKIAPAIACGNTVVCKPSEITPMTAYLLCEILAEAGLPPGVVNMVFGYGAEAGEALVKHPKVPLISFTGGTTTGKHLSATAAPLIKKLSLELGGKNANIIFADANLEDAVQMSLRSSFLNQGEICLCGSRIFVEAPVYESFLNSFVTETRKLKVGDPRKNETFMGALVSQSHLEKVRSYVKLAQEEGGQIETGLEAIPLSDEHTTGYFMRPTIITGLNSQCRVMQEEIFGPVVTIVPFQSEADVITMANSVEYGLSASIWSKNIQRVHRIAQQLDVGTLWVNTWMLRDLRTPFGGMKGSGLGREGGMHSLEFFSETTNVCIKY